MLAVKEPLCVALSNCPCGRGWIRWWPRKVGVRAEVSVQDLASHERWLGLRFWSMFMIFNWSVSFLIHSIKAPVRLQAAGAFLFSVFPYLCAAPLDPNMVHKICKPCLLAGAADPLSIGHIVSSMPAGEGVCNCCGNSAALTLYVTVPIPANSGTSHEPGSRPFPTVRVAGIDVPQWSNC